jgi:predicted nucleic acid-binding protein
MSAAQMSPDTAWVVGSVVTAVVASGPAYLAAKRGASKRPDESAAHAETRATVTDSLNIAVGQIMGRLDAMAAQLSDVQSWQAEHTTEHAVSRITRADVVERRSEGK